MASKIVEVRHSHVILVTDGEVGDHSVSECDKTFEKHSKDFKITKAICFIVSSGSAEVNMSVTCPFTRFCES